MDGVPGIDVSRWQRAIEWQKVRSAGFRFAVIRATIGNYYTDPRFYINWDHAREAGLLISAYHVLTPDRPADSQIDRLFEVLDDRTSDLPVVLDVELGRGMSPEDITSSAQSCAEGIADREGRRPVIYTARWFWDRNVLDGPAWEHYDLWVAHYGTDAPALPSDWDDWTFWQHTDRGKVPGIGPGTDLDWFNGDYAELLAYAGREPVVDEAPPDGFRVRVAVETLTLRSGPGMNYGRVGALQEGDLVRVVTFCGQDVWIQVEPGKWAPFRSRGTRYMELE